MKAAICKGYGRAADVLSVEEVDRPRLKPDQLLVAVKASAVTAGDCRIRSANVPAGFSLLMRIGLGFSRPRNPILGLDFSGVVVAVGEKTTGFEIGDEVFGSTGIRMGCHAECVVVPACSAVVGKPPAVSFESAAAFPFGFLTALSFLRDQAGLREGQLVLVYGASGAVGTAAVQLAKVLGGRVTAVCSGRNVELVRSLGAEDVINYQLQGMDRLGRQFDVVFDTVGKLGFENGVRLTKKGGVFLMAVAGIPDYLRILGTRLRRGRRVCAGMAGEKKEDLEYLSALLATGELKPVIDRRFGLGEIVSAHEYAESGRKRGNVVLTVD